MASTPIVAIFFDGHRSKGHAVALEVRDGRLVVMGVEAERDVPLEALEISPALGRTPRVIRFPDGAFCEVSDHDAFGAMLADHGLDRSGVARWQESRGWIAAAVVGFVGTLIAAYFYGVPAMAGFVADRMPADLLDALSGNVLAVLDRGVFQPSAVPDERRRAVTVRFQQLRLPGGASGARHEILFRRSDALGANAVALPSGRLIVTDDLLDLVRDDRELLAVLAHEAGHVERRHGLRQLLQNSVVALFVAWYVGDVSVVAAAAPTAVLQAKYSRDFEREADDYAAAALRLNDVSPGHLADILQRLDSTVGLKYLSTHPAPDERLARLRAK